MTEIQKVAFILTAEPDNEASSRYRVAFFFTEGALENKRIEVDTSDITLALSAFPELFMRTFTRFFDKTSA